MIYIDYHQTPIGTLKITLNKEGKLIALHFSEQKHSPILSSNPNLQKIHQELDKYFSHQRRHFTISYLFDHGTPFQKKVWEALVTIPYGETRTYQQIAGQCGFPRAYRAVGQAIHNNPIAIIVPCHRVIGKSGDLTGYAAGLYRKKYLIAMEKEDEEVLEADFVIENIR